MEQVKVAGRPGRYAPLDNESIRQVHETSMRVLSEVGVMVPDEETGDVFRDAGAEVDRDSGIARIPAEVVEEKVRIAPREVKLCGLDESNDLLLKDGNVYFGTGGTALNILEYGAPGIRRAELRDLVDVARLVDGLENVHFLLLPTYPNEIPVEAVDINRFYAGLVNTGKHVMGGVYTEEGALDVIRMAAEVAGSREELRRRPIISMITCMISPLKPDSHYTRLMMAIAREGLPVAVPAEPLCGATGPVTLAGNLVMQNVDSLTGVVLTQTVNPGTPVIYGSVASNTNLRNMKYICGSVEMGLLNAAGAQMASHYGLPYYATAGATDSKVVDAQSAYESAITALAAGLAGAHFIHDAAGLMEFAMTVSLEKYVIDNEILGMVSRAIRGIEVNPETLAFDTIRDAGPGGDYISRKHTVKYMRSEHYMPRLSDRLDREDWVSDGSPDATERAHREVQRILQSESRKYVPMETQERIKAMFAEISS